jgi:hypothetical protein
MEKIDHEATLREVLAEVSLLEVGALIKSSLVTMGCMGVLVAIVLLIDTGTGSSDWISSWGIPGWAWWLFFIWLALGAYTYEKSYHEHRFAWYFPRTGYLGSIPIAIYLLLGIELFRAIDPKADLDVRAAQVGLWMLWLLVFALGLGVLEVGYNRLMEKRAARHKTEGASAVEDDAIDA